MPKKTEEKNTKGTKKTTKTSTSKKTTTTAKKVAKEKVVKVPETKVEVKEVPVVKKDKKKGKKSCDLMNNTPFVVSVCIIIILVAILIFVLCIKKVPTTSKGEEIIATLKGKKITADELYIKLKDEAGKDQLLAIIDEYIAEKEVTVTEEDEKYVQEIVDYYKEYAEYYETDLETFLVNYVGLTGISTEKEFAEFVLKDYKKTLAVQKFIGDKTSEEELKKYYKENYTDSLTVKHILIEVDAEAEDADKADEEAYNAAVKLIQKLNKTDKKDLDEKFEELAENNSDDTATYSNGGLIEDFTKKDMVEGFYEAAYELKDGEYTKEPVKTTYGYHIILKVSSTPVEKYKEIKDDVKKAYAEAKLAEDSTLVTTKWDELRKEYKLSIEDDFIKKAYEKALKEAKETELSTFSTPLKSGVASRITNIKITCDKINGRILKPGETFSFNQKQLFHIITSLIPTTFDIFI